MIYLYSGTPGSGKSLNTARQLRNHIHNAGKPAVGNFSFDSHACKPRSYGSYYEVNNSDLTVDFLSDFSNEYRKLRKWQTVPEGEILLVIDEAQLLFNAREWQKTNRDGWNWFFTQHRKMGYVVILVAQFDRMLDRQIRSIIEYEYVHRTMKNMGIYGRILNFICGGDAHAYVKIWYPMQIKDGQGVLRADKGLYRLYNSYAVFDTAAG